MIVFQDPDKEGEVEAAEAAVLVLDTVSHAHGLWLTVRGIGASTAEERKKIMDYFKSRKRKLHLCYRGPSLCKEAKFEALHLARFRWFPPGDFESD